jgi:hypothetical protein
LAGGSRNRCAGSTYSSKATFARISSTMGARSAMKAQDAPVHPSRCRQRRCDPSLSDEVSPLKSAQLRVAQTRAEPEIDRAPLAPPTRRSENRYHLVLDQARLRNRPPPRSWRLPCRIIPPYPLFHRPVVETDELGPVRALGVGVLPATKRPLHVLPAGVPRIAIAKVLPVRPKSRPVPHNGHTRVQAPLRLHVRDVQIYGLLEPHTTRIGLSSYDCQASSASSSAAPSSGPSR